MSRIVVLGGAESGVGAAVLAKVKGFEVFLSDKGKIADHYKEELRKWDIPFEEGQHTESLILNADEIVKSPGIPSTVPMIKKLEAQGTHIISEIEFAGRYDTAKKICITGSNGKTTTTSLIYYLLQQAGLNVGLGGNIGKSYAYQVATEHFDYYVLEISSFQLDNVYDFRPDIAIITNITPDHLDRYGYEMENYVRAKFRITKNLRPEDCFIFDSDDAITIEHLDKIVTKAKQLPYTMKGEVKQGAYVKNDKIVIKYEEDECDVYLNELALGGKHNIYNSMAAALAAKAAGIDNKVIRDSLASFQPIEHRLEPVLSIKDVLYINDSKATNVDAAWFALDAQTKPVVWIVGGTDKGNDYEVLKGLVKEKVRAIVCMGLDNHKFYEAFESIVGKDKMVETKSATEAVQAASKFAQPGDVVLLSPCCASFDLFTCYEDRGEKFKDAVRKL
ncbi:MAG: UDP-N-acetylmuramoyl-L-alanine--D-glutamate ligase [Bacteroidales bacterium]|nr:UDP-N-acetylmuramoyl-L-alanine--D-glutamate ligase [Bacteroidales bacterium]